MHMEGHCQNNDVGGIVHNFEEAKKSIEKWKWDTAKIWPTQLKGKEEEEYRLGFCGLLMCFLFVLSSDWMKLSEMSFRGYNFTIEHRLIVNNVRCRYTFKAVMENMEVLYEPANGRSPTTFDIQCMDQFCIPNWQILQSVCSLVNLLSSLTQ